MGRDEKVSGPLCTAIAGVASPLARGIVAPRGAPLKRPPRMARTVVLNEREVDTSVTALITPHTKALPASISVGRTVGTVSSPN